MHSFYSSAILGIPDAFHLCPMCATGVTGRLYCDRCNEIRKRSHRSWRPPGSASPHPLADRLLSSLAAFETLIFWMGVGAFVIFSWILIGHFAADAAQAIWRVL